jgi:hypothetical protein
LLAFFGSENTRKERNGGMLIAVALNQFIVDTIGAAHINLRSESSECLVAQPRDVQQWRHEGTRALGPVVVTAITSTTPGNINEASGGQNRPIPSF